MQKLWSAFWQRMCNSYANQNNDIGIRYSFWTCGYCINHTNQANLCSRKLCLPLCSQCCWVYWMPSLIDLDTSHPEENKLQTKQARRKKPTLEYGHEQSGQVMKSKAKFGTGLIWGHSYWTSTWWVMSLQAVRKCKIQFCFWSCDLLWPNLLKITPGQYSAQSCFQFCDLPWPISHTCSYI